MMAKATTPARKRPVTAKKVPVTGWTAADDANRSKASNAAVAKAMNDQVQAAKAVVNGVRAVKTASAVGKTLATEAPKAAAKLARTTIGSSKKPRGKK